jgi:GNAT superfamily N-acetyltransferase
MAGILGEYGAMFDAARDDGWVAERDGRVVGSIFLVRSDVPEVAKLRMLYVEPDERGAGIGRQLVHTCLERARELGYRRMTLWTKDVLGAARRLYEAVGFRLISETPHHSFGKDLMGQTWELDL